MLRVIPLTLIALALLAPAMRADTLILKDGSQFEGEIIFQDENQVRFRVQNTVKRPEVTEFGSEEVSEVSLKDGKLVVEEGSATIRETKIFKKDDIERIETPSPDAVYYETLQKLVPTPSLLERSAYEERLKHGPDQFLQDYPESPHRAEVEKVKAALEEELEKVRNGWMKLSGEWISPEDRKTHEDTLEARILAYRMRQYADKSSWLPALRTFERLEREYAGTPAYHEAIPAARKIISAYGNELSGEATSAQYRENQRNASLKEMKGEELEQFREVLRQEDERFKETLEREKKANLVWRSTNPLDLDSFRQALETAKKELDRLKALDMSKLKTAGEKVVQVETLIAEGNLDQANTLLKEVTALVPKGKSGGSVVSRLDQRIVAAREDEKRQEALAQRDQSKSARAVLNVPGASDADETVMDESDEALNALFNTRKESVVAAEPEPDPAEKKRPERTKRTPEEKAAARAEFEAAGATDSGGGGFNPLILLPVILIPATIGVWLLDRKRKKAAAESEETAVAEEPAVEEETEENYDDVPLA